MARTPIIYHRTQPGGPGFQDFQNGKGYAARKLSERGQAHLFQRRTPDGGLDYIMVAASPRTHRFIKEIAR